MQAALSALCYTLNSVCYVSQIYLIYGDISTNQYIGDMSAGQLLSRFLCAIGVRKLPSTGRGSGGGNWKVATSAGEGQRNTAQHMIIRVLLGDS